MSIRLAFKNILLGILSLACSISIAQDLEPRILSPIPIGGNFFVATYGYSTGNILLDNSIPVEGLNAKIHTTGVAYARSFRLLNRLAKFDVIAPYSFATFSGEVSGMRFINKPPWVRRPIISALYGSNWK